MSFGAFVCCTRSLERVFLCLFMIRKVSGWYIIEFRVFCFLEVENSDVVWCFCLLYTFSRTCFLYLFMTRKVSGWYIIEF